MARGFRLASCSECTQKTAAVTDAPVKCSRCLKKATRAREELNRLERDRTWANGQDVAVRARFSPGGRVEWR